MLSKEVYKFVAEQLKPYSADGRVHGGNSMVLSTGGKKSGLYVLKVSTTGDIFIRIVVENVPLGKEIYAVKLQGYVYLLDSYSSGKEKRVALPNSNFGYIYSVVNAQQLASACIGIIMQEKQLLNLG